MVEGFLYSEYNSDPGSFIVGTGLFSVFRKILSAMVDVLTEIVIERPFEEVAAYAANPENAPAWYANIKQVKWRSVPPVRIGSEIDFVAQFMGRELAYTYQVVVLNLEKMVMRTAEGPFPMETTYTWQSTGEGYTHMTIRNKGVPVGFSRLVAPFMRMAMKQANKKDLALLKKIMEDRSC